jgi:hypothetical protein
VQGLHINTKSPASMCFGCTFLSLHALVLFCYDCRFSTTFMRSGSSRSLDLASVGQFVANALVLALQNLISSGVTGTCPYNNLKGVNFVALQTEML